LAFLQAGGYGGSIGDSIARLKGGEVLLASTAVSRTKAAVFGLMGELTAATGAEVALLRMSQGRVLRLGFSDVKEVPAIGALRVIAHSHPSGKLGISGDDFRVAFLDPKRKQRSTIVVGPSGDWRRYTSDQKILGGNS